VNILYPFIQINDADSSVNDEIMNKLRNATKQCQPFHVALDTLGTFGGKSRGVLWLYPRSYHGESLMEEEPLVRLQALLEQAFPTCTDQRPNGQYTPHMTLSHFPSLEDAQNAQLEIESWWPNDVSFFIEEIYLLQRKGDNGQFMRVATVWLGHHDSSGIQLHDPPEPFPAMPLVEEDWVKQERMQLKERRNRSWKGKQRRRGRRRPSSDDSRSSTSRSTDTPEVIATKRAQRKAKREQLQRERLEQETKSDD
jgi:2'-5' RNA ligase